jgi:O-antigen/teichoic acid export membrane protein
MIDAHAVGLYSAGVRLVDLWNIIPAVCIGGLYPALLNARTTSESLYRKRMRTILTVLICTGIGVALITSITAPVLLKLIFGIEFIAGAPALRVYAWSIPGTFLGIYIMNVLFTEDYRKVLIATNLIPAIINILLNIWFIPMYGIVGAAYATVIAYTITPFIPFLFSSTRKHIQNTL